MTRDFVIRAQAVLGLDSRSLAALCGVSRTAVVNWRTGRHRPSGEAVLRIVGALMERRG